MQTINEPVVLLDVLYCTNGFEHGVDQSAVVEQNCILATASTPHDSTMQPLKSRIAISSTVIANGAQHGTATLGVLYNHSSDGQGNTGIYGKAISAPSAFWSAGVHGETRHAGGTSIAGSFEVSDFATSGNSYGVVINNTTGNVPGETHPITNNPYQRCWNSIAMYVTGSEWSSGIKMNSKFTSGKAFDSQYGDIWLGGRKVLGKTITGFKDVTTVTPQEYNRLLAALRQHGILGE